MVRLRTGRGSNGKMPCLNPLFLYITWIPGYECIISRGGRHDIKMHHRKEASWCFGQCSAAQVRILPSMWMFLWCEPPTEALDVHAFLKVTVPDSCGLFQPDNAPTTLKWIRNGSRSTISWLRFQIKSAPTHALMQVVIMLCLCRDTHTEMSSSKRSMAFIVISAHPHYFWCKSAPWDCLFNSSQIHNSFILFNSTFVTHYLSLCPPGSST